MLRKLSSLSLFVGLAILTTVPLANAQAVRSAEKAKALDGKAPGKIVTQVDINFEDPMDYDNFAGGSQPINFILKNPASRQTITLASKLLIENFKPSRDKSRITFYLIIDNLTAPIWTEQGCVETLTNAEITADGNGTNVTINYAPCGTFPPVQNRPGNPIIGVIVSNGKKGDVQKSVGGPVQGIKVGLGKNPPGANMFVIPGGSETGDTAEKMMTDLKQTSAKLANTIIISSDKGAGSPKQAGF